MHKKIQGTYFAIIKSSISVICLITLATTSVTKGAAIIYESFNFADDGTQLAGNSGGTGLGTWDNTGATQTPAGDLTFGTLQTGGSAVQTASLWGRSRVDITADMTSLLADGGEMWFSFRIAKNDGELVRIGMAIGDSPASTNGNLEDEGAGDEQAIGGFLSRNTSTFYSLLWEANSVSTSNLQSGSSPTETTASNLVLSSGANGNSVLVVGHAQWGADGAANDILTLYSPSSSDPTTLGAARAVSQGVVSQDSFDTLSFAAGSNAGGTGFYDEVRIGATFADVVPVPEPSSVALLGLYGLALILRRRR